MLFNLLFLCSAVLAHHHSSDDSNEWHGPSKWDRRSPCPMVNSLANHGYLPRDGLNITLDDLIEGFTDAINLDPAATTLVGKKALDTGDGTSFNLDDLAKPGILEHDGSLSRDDIYFGDNSRLDPHIWKQTLQHFSAPYISIQAAADARKDRLQVAAANNPEFSMTAEQNKISLIETSLYLTVFGNPKREMRILVGSGHSLKEMIPFGEGFQRSENPITVAQILGMVNKVAQASA
ncbi:putative sterigmatocystin biosynthesis peroxidase stcC [Fusarium culmorum]|uniref:Putative sterigmatocystin biosynthesis peroxidase stcC n=1 Tax=Fusarium culmorum TaxID=5516 RepID=A0A2T4GVJ4_FUSCU|nr:putative sterigmatocystin biosynthesis peroxidase stcC [Fusarium culmorum]